MTEEQARAEIRTDLRSDLLKVVVERWPTRPPPTAADVVQRVEGRLAERWQRYFATYESRYLENAAAWTSSLQAVVMERVADLVADLVADYGAPVAAEVLEEAIEQLTQLVVDELAESQKQRDRWVNDLQRRIAAAIGQVSGPLPSNHPGVVRAVEAALDTLAYRLEGFVYELAIDLIRDVAANVLAPLRKAIVDGFQGLRIDVEGTAVRRSTVPDWPVGTAVPLSFTPARNELLLEPVTQYPELFETQVRAQMGGVELGNAVQRARRELITGEKDGESGVQTLISREAGWVPQHDKLRGPNHPLAAQYRVFLHDDDLLGRARNWITRSDTPMGRFLRQSLDRYLNDADLEEKVRAARLVEFDRQLAQTVALSRPLVAIDASAQTDIHGVGVKYVEQMTKFPFTANHPGRGVVRKVLANVPPEKFDSLFGPTDRERIDVFTFLDAPVQPVVMDSLVRPIRQQWEKDRGRAELGGFWTWRRTRPLRWFVPCSPTVRRNIVKGWFVARFLGQIHCHHDDPIGEPTEVWTPRGPQAFPFPLLGPPLRDRDEWLPAVLESLALTVVGESFRGYQRLIDLAVSSGAPDMVNRGGELVSWIRTGSSAANAPVPMPMLAGPAQGSPDERTTILLGNIQRWEEHYGRYRAHRPSRDDGLQISRAWELRDDIVEALADLHRVVEATRKTAPFDDPVAPG